MNKIKHKDSKLVIVANRLPVRKTKQGDWETSPGGLVSALSPFLKKYSGTWVGWPGQQLESQKSFVVDKVRQQPVPLSSSELTNFYYGFSNATLWPLYHDSVQIPLYHRHWWKPYLEINKRFAEFTLKHIQHEADQIWVHDYQLQLVPQSIRQKKPKNRIGFFLHIPFPPVELFAHLPWRRQILEGLLGADLIGFQTESSAKNFLEAIAKFTNAHVSRNIIFYGDRKIRALNFPISVDVKKYEDAAKSLVVKKKAEELKDRLSYNRKLILGVDRLDYTKGIEQRLEAIESLLSAGKISIDDFVYVQVAVPSREKVKSYIDLKTKIETMVGRINGKFAVAGKVPVQYLYRNLSFEDLVAYYLAADIMLVTPLRDGMNLVSKEYVCTRTESSGCLILSEFAGAAQELRDAIIVNPYDVDGLSESILKVINISKEEQSARMKKLRKLVKNRSVYDWAEDFLSTL